MEADAESQRPRELDTLNLGRWSPASPAALGAILVRAGGLDEPKLAKHLHW